VESGISRFQTGTCAVAYRSDGQLLAAADESGLVQLFAEGSNSYVKRFFDSQTPVYFLGFSADRTRLTACTRAGKVLVWDVATEELVFAVQAHSDSIRAAQPLEGDLLATASYDGYLRVWNLRSGLVAAGMSEDPRGRNASRQQAETEPSLVGEVHLGAPAECLAYDQEARLLYVGAGKEICLVAVRGDGRSGQNGQKGGCLELIARNTTAGQGLTCMALVRASASASAAFQSLAEMTREARAASTAKALAAQRPSREASAAASRRRAQSVAGRNPGSLSAGQKKELRRQGRAPVKAYLLAGCANGSVQAYDPNTLAQIATVARLPSAVISLAVLSYPFRDPVLETYESRPCLLAGQVRNAVSLLARDPRERISLALQEAEEARKGREVLTKADLLRQPRPNVDFLVRREIVPKPVGPLEQLLNKFSHTRALELAMNQDVFALAGTVREIEERGARSLQMAVSGLAESHRRKLLEMAARSFGEPELEGPLLRASAACVDMSVSPEGVSPGLHGALVDFLAAVAEEMEVVRGLAEVRGALRGIFAEPGGRGERGGQREAGEPNEPTEPNRRTEQTEQTEQPDHTNHANHTNHTEQVEKNERDEQTEQTNRTERTERTEQNTRTERFGPEAATSA